MIAGVVVVATTTNGISYKFCVHWQYMHVSHGAYRCSGCSAPPKASCNTIRQLCTHDVMMQLGVYCDVLLTLAPRSKQSTAQCPYMYSECKVLRPHSDRRHIIRRCYGRGLLSLPWSTQASNGIADLLHCS